MSFLLPVLRKLSVRWDVLALILVIAMEGLVCAQFFSTKQQTELLAKPDLDNNSWQTYQLQAELYRFDRVLDDFTRGKADADAVVLRLDVLASRLSPVYALGSVQVTPTALQALKTISRKVDDWSHVVPQLAGERWKALAVAERLRQEVRDQEHTAQTLTLISYEVQTLRIDQARQHLYHHFTTLTATFAALGLGASLLLAILVVRSQREKQLTHKLAQLNGQLEAKVTERTQALEEQAKMLKVILESSPVGVALLNESTHQVVFANAALIESLGLPQTQYLGTPLQPIFANPEDEQAFWRKLEQQETVQNYEAELQNAHRRLFGIITAKHLGSSLHPQQLIWIYDISERKQLENRLRELATYDALTGAVSRAFFLEALTLAMHSAQQLGHPLSLLSLDVDHFKRINDTYGHQVGDLALQRLVQLAQSTLRKQDLLGRLGGEEFCIVLPEASTFYAEIIAERIRTLIEASSIELADGQRLHLTVSIGITSMQENDSSENILKQADSALYQAKHCGRNCIAIYA
ncbi:sensor domain-containing diguanylate cyclase [Crenobacter sp. SG2303]|uniref:diguanylate cyclase n=1 Tax=Crenobacter oryzisoli TaxID=3056844 RepID=A0ABT7XV60_9NEIS|nr:sensor domain-containing diguanylate cyclase [Crenobacter sp. SG2303]MDN0077685.1 sensor domain-containing diguanylate cyclase [Crenobacter sp. SG2303]